MRIVFAGTPEFALPGLDALLAGPHEVVAVYTQPDRPAGRGRKLTASPVKLRALAQGVPVEQPSTLRDTQVFERLRDYRPDLMVVAAYGLILPPAVLELPTHGCINIHASLLPRWRGAAPIQRALLAGDARTGVTLMQMATGLDTGDMLLRESCPIDADDTAQSLHDRLAVMGAGLLTDGIDALLAGQLRPEPQDESLATHAAKLSKAEAQIDWQLSAVHLDRCVRAFNPWPVAHTSLDGQTLRIWMSAVANQDSVGERPGTVVQESAAGMDVATGEGLLRILRLQLPGGRPLEAREFLAGHSLLGRVLGSP